MINTYATAAELRSKMSVPASVVADADLLLMLAAVSRELEGAAACGREFFLVEEPRFFDAPRGGVLLIDDTLGVSEVVEDTLCDGTYSTAWVAGTDFVLEPSNGWPKTRLVVSRGGLKVVGTPLSLALSPEGRGNDRARRFRITGTWGYGNGSVNPWKAAGVALTVADGVEEDCTIDVAAGLEAGQTIKAGTEQLFVRAVTDTTATCTRGVNGTTAAAQAGAVVSVMQWPADLTKTAVWLAALYWTQTEYAGLNQLQQGGRLMGFSAPKDIHFRCVGRLSKS